MKTSFMTVKVNGVEFDVDYIYHKPYRGARERGSGIQLEPDEPASVELDDVCIGEYSVFSCISEETMDEIACEILKIINEPPDEY